MSLSWENREFDHEKYYTFGQRASTKYLNVAKLRDYKKNNFVVQGMPQSDA